MSWLSKGIKSLGKAAKRAGVPTTWRAAGKLAGNVAKVAVATQFAPVAGAFAASRLGGAVRGASHLRDSLLQSSTGRSARDLARFAQARGPAGYGAPPGGVPWRGGYGAAGPVGGFAGPYSRAGMYGPRPFQQGRYYW